MQMRKEEVPSDDREAAEISDTSVEEEKEIQADEDFEKTGSLNGRTYGLVTLDETVTARAFAVSLSKIGIDPEVLAEAGHQITYTIEPAGAASLVRAPERVKDEAFVTFGVKPQVGYEILQVTANGEELDQGRRVPPGKRVQCGRKCLILHHSPGP